MNLFWEGQILLWLRSIILSSPLFTWEVQFQVRLLFSEEAKIVTCCILCPLQLDFSDQQKKQSWGQRCEQPWDVFGGVAKEQSMFDDRINGLGRRRKVMICYSPATQFRAGLSWLPLLFSGERCSCLCVHWHLLRFNVRNETWTYIWNCIIWTKWTELMNERVRFT